MKESDFERVYEQYRGQDPQPVETEQENNSNKEAFVAVRKNDEGNIIAFKTNTGRELDYVTALEEAKAGHIAHVDVFHKYGRDIIRSEPDGIEENNLSHLPIF